MKIVRTMIVASAVLALGLAACGKKDEDKKTGDTTAPAATKAEGDTTAADKPAADEAPAAAGDPGARSIEMMKSMAKAAADNKGDCDKQAAALQKIVDDNKDLMAEMKKADEDEAKKKEYEEKYGKQAMEIMGGMMGDLGACAENEALQAVFESFE